MHPYLPFAALPVAALAAWFGASQWSASEPGRYQISRVAELRDPSVVVDNRVDTSGTPDIRVAAFLPHVPPRPAAPEPTLVLHSVMTGQGVRLATINGKILKEGDRVEGYLVRRISDDGVELAAGGKTRRLPMRPLHELPPPARPGESLVPGEATAQRGGGDLTEDFWKIFDSLKP